MINITLILITLLLTYYNSTNLPFELGPREYLCFYETTQTVPAKCSFFFAVHKGDSFEVNYSVKLPNSDIFFTEHSKTQGDFVFTMQQIGDYSFCFENPINDHKVVDIDVKVEFSKQSKSHLKFHSDSIQNSINSLDKILGSSASILKITRAFKAEQDREDSSLNGMISNVKWFVLTMIASSLALIGFNTISIKYLLSSKNKFKGF